MDAPHPDFDPPAHFDDANPLRPDARYYRQNDASGKPCTLIDNTGDALPEAECQAILQALIENRRFGFRSLSAQGGDAIRLDRREASHVQVGETLYRLVIWRHEARLEPF